jgi:hypothetical protein
MCFKNYISCNSTKYEFNIIVYVFRHSHYTYSVVRDLICERRKLNRMKVSINPSRFLYLKSFNGALGSWLTLGNVPFFKPFVFRKLRAPCLPALPAEEHPFAEGLCVSILINTHRHLHGLRLPLCVCQDPERHTEFHGWRDRLKGNQESYRDSHLDVFKLKR